MKKQLLLLTMFSLWSILSFAQVTTVGLIGDATPDGWDNDTDMIQDAGDTAVWTLDVTLTSGEAKFRANDAWDINWGSADFPTGTGTQGGDNISVTAGDYAITFNSNTGDYDFVLIPDNSFSVGIIGDATPGGWDNDTDMIQDAGDTAVWTLEVTMTDGEAKFRANDAWDINWGSADFPTGTGTQGGDNIAVTAGDYAITFNSNTGDYDFVLIPDNSFSVGIIGDATPGGWDNDTDMIQDAGDTAVWTLEVTMTDGEAKFRANDAWDINWGDNDFPMGTGTQGGDNIPIVAGEYIVHFNSNTGDYNFEDNSNPPGPKVNSIGLIGSGTPDGWDMDTDMTRDAVDTALWTIVIELTADEVKFRADDVWDLNWGSPDFPNGTGTQGGDNIPVLYAGEYTVTFNSNTGDYNFTPNTVIGIIGDATPGGWDNDTNMFKDTTENVFVIDLNLTAGEAKFRKDDAWDVNWGAADFPIGTGTQGGDNILVDAAGLYHITLDTMSGAYTFTAIVNYSSISLIGDATPGGWDNDTDMTRSATNPDEWTTDVTLVDGELKFRANNAWDISWGDGLFPADTATLGGGNIAATAGTYRVTFNTETLIYDFVALASYNSIGLVGDATPGGWDTDTEFTQDENDDAIWRATVELTQGDAKFRADNAWDVSWGGEDFPFGTAVLDGPDIPVEAGGYNITFNTITGEYAFEVFVVYDQIAVVGKDGPFGVWPDDTGDLDFYLTVDSDDNQLWTGSDIALTTADTTAGDSGIKFRADTDWTNNWGDRSFPGGIGTPGGDNIWCLEGNYDVSINTLTGEYLFSPADGTTEVLNPADITIFPNPTKDFVNVTLEKIDMTGDVSIRIYDMSGRNLISTNLKVGSTIQLDTKTLENGQYFVQISNEKYTIGKRFTVIK